LQFKFAYMPIPITIPKATITMEEANVVSWRKQVGEVVTKDDVLFEIETDKVIVEVPAPASGVLLRIDVAEGTAKLGQAIGWIGEASDSIPDSGLSSEDSTASAPSVRAPAPSSAAPGVGAATPAARRLARELSIDLASVVGTGPGGRILEIDVRNARRNL
jgi:pyruvate/2-oxoglutarate dehydrogenase complex dihydrolipoamide acyltransferase (E2) component